MWPQMCFWIAIYLFWFECARPAAKLALTVREQLGHEFCRRWFGLLAFLCLVAYFLISYFYKYHRLDEPHFQYFIAVPQVTNQLPLCKAWGALLLDFSSEGKTLIGPITSLNALLSRTTYLALDGAWELHACGPLAL